MTFLSKSQREYGTEMHLLSSSLSAEVISFINCVIAVSTGPLALNYLIVQASVALLSLLVESLLAKLYMCFLMSIVAS